MLKVTCDLNSKLAIQIGISLLIDICSGNSECDDNVSCDDGFQFDSIQDSCVGKSSHCVTCAYGMNFILFRY